MRPFPAPSRASLLALCLALALPLALTACGGDAPTEPAPPAEGPTAEVLTDPEAAATDTVLPPAGPDEGAAPALDANAEAALREALEGLVYTEGADPSATTPGVVLFLDTPEGRFAHAAGVTSLGADSRPVRPEDSFEIGSSTKPMTAVVILQLMEEGLLDLDDTLDVHLPEIAARLPGGQSITLRQLLNHTAGVRDYANPLMQAAVDAAAEDPSLLEQGYAPEELVDYAIEEGSPLFEPGAEGQWAYSSTGYVLLGLVAEALTGQPMAELYQERIFGPLGMETAFLLEGVPEPAFLSTRGYYPAADPPADASAEGALIDTTRWNASQGWAAGGAAMTAEDLARFARAVGQRALFRDPATADLMLDFVDLPYDNALELLRFDGYGLGLQRFGEGFYGHNGQSAGFQSIWAVEPETGLVLVGLVNNAAFSAYDLLSAREVLRGPVACPDPGPFPLAEPDYDGKRPLDLAPFQEALAGWEEGRGPAVAALLDGATIPDMQAAMAAGELSAVELLTHYLARIRRYDVDKLNSVLELDPEALRMAADLDAERAAGAARGPLHGIPLLVKDNIQVAGRLHTAAGAHALKDWVAPEDAFLVARLREAGALVFGKANLSEWANYLDPCVPNGFSALGGQTRHPYGPYDPLGSSTGSAVAAAAGLAAATVGTETQGSIIAPSLSNGVVGLKTSRGLVSRGGVIPLVAWMDAPGPIGRSVTDVAQLLTAMAGADPEDPEGARAAELEGLDFAAALSQGVSGLRVGVFQQTEESARAMAERVSESVREQGGEGFTEAQLEELAAELLAGAEEDPTRETARAALEAAGATIVPLGQDVLPTIRPLLLSDLLEHGFQVSYADWAGRLGEAAPFASLAEIAAANDEAPGTRIPYGQAHLRGAAESSITEAEGAGLKADYVDAAGRDLAALFADQDLDLIVVAEGYQAYAPAGFPALTVPAGLSEEGEPFGVLLVGDAFGEEALLRAGHALEQVLPPMPAPDLDAVVATFPE